MQKLSTRKSHRVPSRCAPADGTPLKTASVCPADSLRVMLHRLVARGRTDAAHWHEADVSSCPLCVRVRGKAQRFGTFADAGGSENQNSFADASRAPSLRVRSFAQTTSGATRPHPAEVSKPQSFAASTAEASPITATIRSMRSATTSGCSIMLVQRVDYAGHQNLCGLQRKLLEAAEFMRVTRAGEGQIQSPDVRLLNDRQDILKRDIAVMRTFRIAPTHVQAHTV